MLPKYKRGRPPKDMRLRLNGILWMARTGARWRDMPSRYGPVSTVYRNYRRWRESGVLCKIFEFLHHNRVSGSPGRNKVIIQLEL